MNQSAKLRRRVLQHLLLGGATVSGGCIETHTPTPEDAGPSPAADLEVLPTVGICDRSFCVDADSSGVCPSEDDVPHGYLEGSGCCQHGPYGPYRASDEAASPTEPCCYFVEGSQCEGRPFLVGAEDRHAPIVQRTDWC